MSYVSIAFIVALGVFQVLGGLVEHFLNWRFDFLLMAILGVLAFLLVYSLLPETRQQNSIQEKEHGIIKSYFTLINDRYFIFAAVGGGIGYGMIIAFHAISPFLMQNELHLTSIQYGHLGLLISSSYLLGSFIVSRYIKVIGIENMIKTGICLIIPFAVIMLLMGISNLVNVVAIMLPLCFITVGQALIYPCAMTLALKYHAKKAAYTTALFGFVQQILSSITAGVAAHLPKTTQLPLAALILVIGIISGLFLLRAIYNFKSEAIID